MQTRNYLSFSDGDRPKSQGNYTGERLKLLRPETYRRVVEVISRAAPARFLSGNLSPLPRDR